MIPLRDNIPSHHPPLTNYVVLFVTSCVFLLQLAAAGRPGEGLEEKYGMIPIRVLHPHETVKMQEVVRIRGQEFVRIHELPATTIPPWITLVSCMFLHGGWLHFLGNMWFLYIFGDNVEDRLGHVGYALFYLVSGVAAGLVHLVTNASSPVPTIGASGAIAGVMGAYFVLYPRATVLSLVPLLGFAQIVVLPAPLFLGFWFLMQFFQGTMAITSMRTGGVAWWAHIGGFVVGVLAALILRAIRRDDDAHPPFADHRSRVGMYRYR
ncbi:MAG: rhomboid family intramembrane serine protease [Planctomycetes bacterium]|nr:rhomboid family intramembrane serine protease [Planctomycetota bacterium]